MSSEIAVMPPVCPPEEIWAYVAGGSIDQTQSEQLLLHAASCGACARQLRRMIDALRTDTRIAKMPFRRWRPMLWSGIAAAFVAALLAWQWQSAKQPPLSQLAAVYQDYRIEELRIPGAGYARLISLRGASSGTSPQLAILLRRIEQGLASRPNDPGWLHAAGRAELIRQKPEEANRYLEAARLHGADSAGFWVDSGIAYFERAELAGDPAIYRLALGSLDKAIARNSSDPSAFFNRAIVKERLHDSSGAVKDLATARNLESDAGWAHEIAERLQRTRENPSGRITTDQPTR